MVELVREGKRMRRERRRPLVILGLGAEEARVIARMRMKEMALWVKMIEYSIIHTEFLSAILFNLYRTDYAKNLLSGGWDK
ncbi:hypothetical protein QJS04_geneDACA012431 [Acorus gramineus]|uniref:Uncharacterized protein n=1 Tax=Acorus gramineus TaxID=55184 RepID=A0AAV9BC30_ACOGR|nr:hypothetical protein QJS04_geneDACA012431 [Acorus gramineus]